MPWRARQRALLWRRAVARLARLLILAAPCASGQQWLVPDACWALEMDAIGSYRRDYWHVGDTMADGSPAQVVRWTQSMVLPGGPIGPPSNPQTTLYRMAGDVVYARSLFPQLDQAWDTPYYLGDQAAAGGRDWPHSKARRTACSRSRTQAASFSKASSFAPGDWPTSTRMGAPTPLSPGEDSLVITERMGAPSPLAPRNCDNLEWVFSRRLHYHDPEVSVPLGGSCVLALSQGGPAPCATFTIYPNPASYSLTVELGHALKTAKLVVRDARGCMVMEQPVSGSPTCIGLQELSEGLYSLELLDSGRRSSMQRLVVQR
jgi:hypothetical protein